ncbi:PstS family phosphate ABC transporter substrate-binding protein [candidate division KSB1 bacterium]|nr:PstS family phosphate ABC transporter substrate-binding protein [candidate division KSB1 bacterium]
MLRKITIATLILVMISSINIFSQDMIQIKGSDTLVNLVQRLSEVYMEKYPDSYIAVTGGGSGVGIAALISNRIAIADASRPMKDKEYAAAKENGVAPYELVIGIDGLSVIINSNNPIKSLTTNQIGAIFRGEINNWSEVGGPNLPISLYGHQANSGTYVFFQEHVLQNKNYSAKMKRMNGNAQIVEGIKADKSGIGYVGVGYVFDENRKVIDGITVLEVANDSKSKPVTPLVAENVKSGLYPISRALYQYVNGKPTGDVKKFIAFELSADGQKVVEEMGFFPVAGKYLEQNAKAGL